MWLDTLFIPLLILILSIVQSLFGVGLLIFGTPILLFKGYAFEEVLFYLLPCSLMISFVQTLQGWGVTKELRKYFLFSMVPFVVFGLLLVFLFGKTYNAR